MIKRLNALLDNYYKILIGEFAALGHKSFEFVEKNNLVVLFDNSDPDGIHWHERYANKTIEIFKMYNGKLVSFNATIGKYS